MHTHFAPAALTLSAMLASPLAFVAHADDAAIDPKAEGIYNSATAAAKALNGVELVSQMTITGVPEGMLPPGFGQPAQFACEFAAPGAVSPFGRLYMTETSESPSWRFAFDGKTAICVENTKKEYQSNEDGMWFGILGEHMSGIPQWFFETRSESETDQDPRVLTGASLVGSETLDGTECDVVKIVRTLTEGEETITFSEEFAVAKSDSLPRRVTQEVSGPGAPAGMKMVSTFTKVKANPNFAADYFSTAAPEGYTKAEMPAPEEFEQPELKIKKGDAAPAFALKTIAGEEVSLDSLKGKIVLLDFWATWCGPCKKAMPSIQKIADDYKDKGVVVYGVNVWERKENAAKDYLEKNPTIQYPTLLGGDELAGTYGVTGIPTLVIIGKDGKVSEIEVGFAGDEGLRKAIDAALEAK